jgi:hypothetical protein
MSKLGAAPSLAHATEADSIDEGWTESVEDDAEQVVRKFGPWTAVAARSFRERCHYRLPRRDLVKQLSRGCRGEIRSVERDLVKQLDRHKSVK